MAAISWGQGRFRSNSRTRCPLPLAMALSSFIGITKIDLEKVQKCGNIVKLYPHKYWSMKNQIVNSMLVGTTHPANKNAVQHSSTRHNFRPTIQHFHNCNKSYKLTVQQHNTLPTLSPLAAPHNMSTLETSQHLQLSLHVNTWNT